MMVAALVSGIGVGAGALGYRWRKGSRQCSRPASATYVPFQRDVELDYSKWIVLDSTHPLAPTLTHHKGHSNVAGAKPSDCSTGYVLNCLNAQRAEDCPSSVSDSLRRTRVTCDHYDIDGLLAIWSWTNRDAALKHETVLRATARIGDFREATLPALYAAGVASAEAKSDGSAHDAALVTRALQLACWLSAQETDRFSAPFECKDSDEKYTHFLAALGDALDRGPPEAEWQPEYDTVMAGLASVRDRGSVEQFPDIGLTVVRAPQALHYYSLFSHSVGSDAVLSVYPGNRYEVECKYTQFVMFSSRPVRARLDLQPLAQALNKLEEASGAQWACSRLIDSGPILRLDTAGKVLNKRQRYGHPTDRPILSSSIPADLFQAIVVSFFEHGLQGVAPRAGGWSWAELHAHNASVDWAAWAVPRAAMARA